MTDTAPAPSQPVATEIDVGTAAAPPSPMRKVILIALGTLLVLFIYHGSDRCEQRSALGGAIPQHPAGVGFHSWRVPARDD